MEVRSKTKITVEFTLDATTGTVTNSADYLSVTLPSNWRGYLSAASIGKVDISSVAADGTETSVGTTVLYVSGRSVVIGMDDTNVFAEGTNYKVTLSDIPTPSQAAKVNLGMGSLVLGVGLKASGGTGWSSSSLFRFKPAEFDIKTGILALEFSKGQTVVNRGTYSGEVCV